MGHGCWQAGVRGRMHNLFTLNVHMSEYSPEMRTGLVAGTCTIHAVALYMGQDNRVGVYDTGAST